MCGVCHHPGYAPNDVPSCRGWVENVIGSNFGDTIRGNRQANWIYGGRGSDNLSGTSIYHDPITMGKDAIFGGDSSDTLHVRSSDVAYGGHYGNDYKGSAFRGLPENAERQLRGVMAEMEDFLHWFENGLWNLSDGQKRDLINSLMASGGSSSTGGFNLVGADVLEDVAESMGDAADGVVGTWVPELKLPDIEDVVDYSESVATKINQTLRRLGEVLDSTRWASDALWHYVSANKIPVIEELTRGVDRTKDLLKQADVGSAFDQIGRAFGELTEDMIKLAAKSYNVPLETYTRIANFINRSIAGTILDYFTVSDSLSIPNAVPSELFEDCGISATESWEKLEKSAKWMFSDKQSLQDLWSSGVERPFNDVWQDQAEPTWSQMEGEWREFYRDATGCYDRVQYIYAAPTDTGDYMIEVHLQGGGYTDEVWIGVTNSEGTGEVTRHVVTESDAGVWAAKVPIKDDGSTDSFIVKVRHEGETRFLTGTTLTFPLKESRLIYPTYPQGAQEGDEGSGAGGDNNGAPDDGQPDEGDPSDNGGSNGGMCLHGSCSEEEDEETPTNEAAQVNGVQ